MTTRLGRRTVQLDEVVAHGSVPIFVETAIPLLPGFPKLDEQNDLEETTLLWSPPRVAAPDLLRTRLLPERRPIGAFQLKLLIASTLVAALIGGLLGWASP